MEIRSYMHFFCFNSIIQMFILLQFNFFLNLVKSPRNNTLKMFQFELAKYKQETLLSMIKRRIMQKDCKMNMLNKEESYSSVDTYTNMKPDLAGNQRSYSYSLILGRCYVTELNPSLYSLILVHFPLLISISLYVKNLDQVILLVISMTTYSSQ